ncbi:MAG: hypothetical protein QOD63_1484 [Actinomycetota bacterium]|jgi:hypothetical protein|nr:hypothetical protein [Actinomycetota bacterium]
MSARRTCRACRASVAALVTVLLLSLAPPATADVVSDEARVVALIHEARAAAGAPLLPLHPGLSSAARTWATTMAAAGTISHNVGLGSVVTASRLTENVGMGGSVDAIHQAFLASAGHRANLLDTNVNAMGVGVAYANGYVFVVQDYGMVPTPPPNRPPGTPTGVTPAHGSVVQVPPATVSAQFSDPDGNLGHVHFLVVDELGRTVREGDSGQVCSGCVATLGLPVLADGVYAAYAYAVDTSAASFWSAARIFAVDRNAPLAPAALARSGNQATAVYSEPDGTAGYVYVYLIGPNGTLVSHGWTPQVCSGCTASYALPGLTPGTYTLYAVAYDGLVSPMAGPVSFVV